MAWDELKIQQNIEIADRFVKRTYLNDLTELEVEPLSEHQKKFQYIRLYRVSRLIYDKSEDINDKLVSVFNSVQNTRSNLVLILRGLETEVEFYIGVQSNREIGVADKVFGKSFLGNFPGSMVEKIPQSEVADLLTSITTFDDCNENLTCLNVIPAVRNQEDFIQGLEKYIDTMKGESYVCMILASSVSDNECEERLNGYQQLHTTLFPLSNMTLSHGTSEGTTITDGYTSTISNSVSDSLAKTVGTSQSDTINSGFNVGLFGMGFNSGYSHTFGTTNSDTKTASTTKQTSEATSKTEATSETVTDNVSITYKDKGIEDTLEHIERRIERIKDCMTFGMWECAAYFMSGDIQTSVVSANAFRSIMLGEENKNEKSHLNLFGRREQQSTLNAIEYIKYCRHPRFYIDTLKDRQTVTATEYLSGKEIPLLFALPRKSVAGVTVTSMAEFGRNIVFINERKESESKALEIGKITHMNRVEDTSVKLDLQSLSSHCFVTGSTGSGKSNTTFTMLGELLKPENNIPFLVVEPAKGEYKYAFAGVPGINIFTVTYSVGRFLKLNPFKFHPNVHVLEHLDRLIEIFNTCWEMYAAMPAILKDAIEKIYEKAGWDLMNSVYLPGGEPQYPTFKDLLNELPNVINNSGYSSDTKGDYVGALVTRVNSLTNGLIGQVFCGTYDIDDEVLFDQNTIVDLSRVGSSETKSLIMGILVLKLTEYRMGTSYANNSALRHVTVLEEAHNLLKNMKNAPGGASAVIAKSVEMICNSIAEMRTYGESFILVDQSPGAVDIAAIKNTNTKIIMRLPESSDCEAIGRSVSLNEQQILELSKLRTGAAVVMQNNWCDAVLAQINRYEYPYEQDITSYSGTDILRFKSAVVGELLNQYTIGSTKDMHRILEVIESFDIDYYKKEDARAMVRNVCSTLDKQWNNVVLGKVLMQYLGTESIFRRAEQIVPDMPRRAAEDTGSDVAVKEQESVKELFRFLEKEIDTLLTLNEEQRRSLIQYMVYVKAYETSEVNYDRIYRIHYVY